MSILPSSRCVPFDVVLRPGADTAAGVVATLLELGADVNRDDGDPEIRYTPLHSAVANEVSRPAPLRDFLQLTYLRFSVFTRSVYFCGPPARARAILPTQAPALVRTVLQHGARVNTPRGDRRIPLHTAMRLPAGQKKLSIIATLLVVGADIDRPGMLDPSICIPT